MPRNYARIYSQRNITERERCIDTSRCTKMSFAATAAKFEPARALWKHSLSYTYISYTESIYIYIYIGMHIRVRQDALRANNALISRKELYQCARTSTASFLADYQRRMDFSFIFRGESARWSICSRTRWMDALLYVHMDAPARARATERGNTKRARVACVPKFRWINSCSLLARCVNGGL